MEVIPAIDIMAGKCVRLEQGEFERSEIFAENPLEMAEHWQQQGANRLHLVDLDGARAGRPQNQEIIKEIITTLKIPVQIGGGLRTFAAAADYLQSGADRIILGTAAVKNPALVKRLLVEFDADSIVIGVDARNGKVAVQGWQEQEQKTVRELILEMKEKGIRTFIYTDIGRDGMLTGPDLKGISALRCLGDIEIIASGGIADREDLERLSAAGIKSAIVGKALYKGKVKDVFSGNYK